MGNRKRKKARTVPDDPKNVARTSGALEELRARALKGQGMVLPAMGVATIVSHIAMVERTNQFLFGLVQEYENLEDDGEGAPVTAPDEAQDLSRMEGEGGLTS